MKANEGQGWTVFSAETASHVELRPTTTCEILLNVGRMGIAREYPLDNTSLKSSEGCLQYLPPSLSPCGFDHAYLFFTRYTSCPEPSPALDPKKTLGDQSFRACRVSQCTDIRPELELVGQGISCR